MNLKTKYILTLLLFVVAIPTVAKGFFNPAPEVELQQDLDPREATLKNFKQVAMGFMIYLADHDDQMPERSSSQAILELVEPYLQDTKFFATFNPNKSEMLFNMRLKGKNVAEDYDSPSKVPMLYESKAWPNGSRCVAFLDGAAKFVEKDEWEKLEKLINLEKPVKKS